MKDEDKPIVLLTNFWDANTLIDYSFMLFQCKGQEKVYKLNFIKNKIKEKRNYSVYSIALRHPHLKNLPNLGKKEIDCIEHFCPTWDMLLRYKNDKNWEAYEKDYRKLLKQRKSELKKWINSLQPRHIYILCCWENTACSAHCHRDILFDVFNRSKSASEKILSIYRYGDKIYKKVISDYEENVRMPVGYTMAMSPSEFLSVSSPHVNTLPGLPITVNSEGEIMPFTLSEQESSENLGLNRVIIPATFEDFLRDITPEDIAPE